MANIGYIQVTRQCNHVCGFCSNPTLSQEQGRKQDFVSVSALIDDFAERGYYGVILTGGEPTLHRELPRIIAYARSRELHVRMITNGHRLAEDGFAETIAEAGLQMVHVSVYSVRPDVEARIRGRASTLERAYRALDACSRLGMDVNVNCVINRLNADHLDENIAHFIEHHPQVRHFVWNALDPSMGRAETSQAEFTPRLADLEVSLKRATALLTRSGRTFRVERVPLCYMADFAHTSTETRKIVKAEERIVHFLDDKQTVRQTEWTYRYASACGVCSLRSICAGLFERGDGYSPDELQPVFVPKAPIVAAIHADAPVLIEPVAPPAPVTFGAEPPPQLVVPLGPTCNNHCLFCPHSPDEAAPGSVPEALKVGAERGLRRAVFVGGEPTLHDELPGWIEAARALGFTDVALATNGRRLAYRAYAQTLASAGLTAVEVALHGPEPDAHDYHTRVSGSFRQTVKGLLNARALSVALGVSTVITRSNFRNLAALEALLERIGVSVWSLSRPLAGGSVAPPLPMIAGPVRDALARAAAGGITVLGSDELRRALGPGPYQEP